MGWELEGDYYVLQERTRKPFERFKIEQDDLGMTIIAFTRSAKEFGRDSRA
jgi:hypothetical protein